MRTASRWRAAALSSLFLHAVALYWISVSSGTAAHLPRQEHWPSLQVRLGLLSAPAAVAVKESSFHRDRSAERKLAAPAPEQPASAGHDSDTPAGKDNATLFPLLDDGYLPARELDGRPTPVAPVILPFPDSPLDKPRATAILLLYIGSDGVVDRIEIEDSDLPLAFEHGVVQTFRHVHMRPGMKDGKKVRALMKIQVEYESP